MYSVFGMFLCSLLKTPPYSLFSLFLLFVLICYVSPFLKADLADSNSDDDDKEQLKDTGRATRMSSASSHSGGSTDAPAKKRKKASTTVSVTTGFAAEICKVICCNKSQPQNLTRAKTFEELTGHIRSILNGSDVNDKLAEDWTFLGLLVSLDILKSDDLCLYKSQQTLQDEIVFLESLNAQILDEATGTRQLSHSETFLKVLEQIQAPLLSRIPEVKRLTDSNNIKLDFLLKSPALEEKDHWVNKIKSALNNPTIISAYFDESFKVRVCSSSKNSSTGSCNSDSSESGQSSNNSSGSSTSMGTRSRRALLSSEVSNSSPLGAPSSPLGVPTPTLSSSSSLSFNTPLPPVEKNSTQMNIIPGYIVDNSNVFGVCENPDKSRILRAKVQGTGASRKKSMNISPVLMQSLEEAVEDKTLRIEVFVKMDDFEFTQFDSDPTTVPSQSNGNVYCTLCKIKVDDTNHLLLISPAEVDPLVGIAVSMVPIKSTYNKDSTKIRETANRNSYCCVGNNCLPLGLQLLNEYMENTCHNTGKRSILGKYIDIMRCHNATIQSKEITNTQPLDDLIWSEKMLREKIEDFMVDQMVIHGIVRCSAIMERFGAHLHLFATRYDHKSKSPKLAEFCQSVLLSIMEDSYFDFLYVVENEVATTNPKYHSWTNGFFKYTGPHTLFVAGL